MVYISYLYSSNLPQTCMVWVSSNFCRKRGKPHFPPNDGYGHENGSKIEKILGWLLWNFFPKQLDNETFVLCIL